MDYRSYQRLSQSEKNQLISQMMETPGYQVFRWMVQELDFTPDPELKGVEMREDVYAKAHQRIGANKFLEMLVTFDQMHKTQS